MIRRSLITVLIAMLVPVIPALAQQDTVQVMSALDSLRMIEMQDSIKRVQKEMEKKARREAQKDISGYAMQKRYRPTDEKSSFGKLLSNTFLWGYGSFYSPIGGDYSYGPLASAGIGRWFTQDGIHRYHGVRVGLGAGYFFDNYDASRVKTADASMSYMFDLSSYTLGYNPDRLVSIVPIAGAAFHFTESSVGSLFDQGSVSLHAGVDFAFHAMPGIDIVVEPMFMLQSDPRKIGRENIWRSYVPVFAGNVGLNIYLDRNYWLIDPGKDWRFSLGGGFALLDSYLLQEMKDIKSLLGPTYTFGLGRGFTDRFAWRVQGAYSKSFWDRDPDAGRLFFTHYYQVRLDGMYDVLPFLGLFAGPEIGFLSKEGSGTYSGDQGLRRRPYVGASAGAQLRLHLFKGLYAFTDARVSLIPYAYVSNDPDVRYRNYQDYLSSLTLGVEYRVNAQPLSQRRSRPKGIALGDWYALAYGSFYRPNIFSGNSGSGPFMNIGGGFWFKAPGEQYHDRSGVRMNTGLGYYVDNVSGYKVKMLATQFSYVYDYSDRLWGPGKHALGIYPFAGVDYIWFWTGRPVSFSQWESTFGAHAGITFTTPILPGTELIAEPVIQAGPTPKPGVSAWPWHLNAIVNIGLKTGLERYKWGSDPGNDWRVGASLTTNPGLALHFARNYYGWLDWRLMGGYEWLLLTGTQGASGKTHIVYARLDGLVDLTCLLGNESSRLHVSPFAGPEAGVIYQRGQRFTPFVGASAGVQLKYRLTERLSLFADPRISLLPRPQNDASPSRTYTNSVLDTYTISFGVEYAL